MTDWHTRFETGFPQIDEEHQEFFRRLDALRTALRSGAGRDKSAELIGLLQKYALQHFAREEAVMRQVGCAALGKNCAAHRAFAERMEGWLDLLCSGGGGDALAIDIEREASEWMEKHILQIDCQLRHCLPKKPE